MRRIVHVPIVHSQTDLGPIQDRVRQAYIDKGGEQAWRASREALAQFWKALEQVMDHLPVDYARLRIYQDGLPVCGQEERIVRDLAEQGGANYRILQKLAGRGARIEGTEDPDLLRKEYELIMNSSLGPSGGEAASADDAEKSMVLRDLLDRRDRFIAARIDKTLQEGETGLLFLGAMHNATAMLPESIEVLSLTDLLRNAAAT
ncbi:hypothetical protein SAMN02745126_01732 [Enhydrobacter aerosaccus]|uniref:Uncharacterized protein n=1 Tax=Enhydrobacter aerosaccus TaxID=225324 RepID=A0A1T4LUM8_9HYPH|nr:hypothetical protein [Enhydrobacter aerosaccus]SJZ58449.1 hypothetical protein SAMN02745126_01732 [Enhydrobacter aerosaccus]